MCSSMFSILILLFLFSMQTTFSNETFIAISTTDRPAYSDNIAELKIRIACVESQNVLIQKLLDEYRSNMKKHLMDSSQNKKKSETNLEHKDSQTTQVNFSRIYEEVQRQGQNVSEEIRNKLISLEYDIIHHLEMSNKSQEALFKILEGHSAQLARIEKILEDLSKKSSVNENLPRNCKEVQRRGQNISGVYAIQPRLAPGPFLVRCDMQTQDGGWALFLNRSDGSQDFGLDWKEYKIGFGTLDGEFWLGLDNIHYLTGSEVNELLIQLIDWDFKKTYALYSTFGIGSEGEGYSLKLLGEYSGDAGDSLSYHLGMKFSTKDKDQDIWSNGSCAANIPSGWWFKSCEVSRLTGRYLGETIRFDEFYTGVYWGTFHGFTYSLKEARMMIRPAA